MDDGIDGVAAARLAEIDAGITDLRARFLDGGLSVGALAAAVRPLLAERAALAPRDIADAVPDDSLDGLPPDDDDDPIPDDFPSFSPPAEPTFTRFVRALSAFCDAYLTPRDRRA